MLFPCSFLSGIVAPRAVFCRLGSGACCAGRDNCNILYETCISTVTNTQLSHFYRQLYREGRGSPLGYHDTQMACHDRPQTLTLLLPIHDLTY